MRRSASLLCLLTLTLTLTLAGVAAAQDPVLIDPENPNSRTCTEGNGLTIKESKATLMVFGPCETVLISGSDNSVKIDQANVINVTGDGNQVIWGSGTTTAEPTRSLAGRNNVVERRKD